MEAWGGEHFLTLGYSLGQYSIKIKIILGISNFGGGCYQSTSTLWDSNEEHCVVLEGKGETC